ncbi:MAG: hypothetical protein GPJ54_22595 [Candidatus Heimdallarchaeota archaeon]|nr:hypothetical protein [Candidatus Heimdallarchaeota archaeon]
MSELTGIAKTIFDEVMDEIEEEILESLESYILKEKLEDIISDIQQSTTPTVIKTINDNYSENMSAAKKMILGEKLARVVTAIAKEKIQNLVADILKHSFDVIDELRNEIIGEVFEETES